MIRVKKSKAIRMADGITVDVLTWARHALILVGSWRPTYEAGSLVPGLARRLGFSATVMADPEGGPVSIQFRPLPTILKDLRSASCRDCTFRRIGKPTEIMEIR